MHSITIDRCLFDAGHVEPVFEEARHGTGACVRGNGCDWRECGGQTQPDGDGNQWLRAGSTFRMQVVEQSPLSPAFAHWCALRLTAEV
jgi:hypothetical protein